MSLLARFATLALLAVAHFPALSLADPPDVQELRREEDERSRAAALGHLLTANTLEKTDPRTARDHLEKCKALLDDDSVWLQKSTFSRQERKALSRLLTVKIRDLKAYEIVHAEALAALDKLKLLSAKDEFWQAHDKKSLRYREVRIIRMLHSSMSIDFKGDDSTLNRGLDYIDDKTEGQLNMVLDDTALREAMIDVSEKMVTLKMKKYPVHVILKKMLGDIGLDYCIENGYLRITTKEKAQASKVTRVHDLAGLLDAKNLERSKAELLEALNLMLAKEAAEAKLMVFTTTQRLVVQASVETQFRIERLLAELKGTPEPPELSGIDLDNNNRN